MLRRLGTAGVGATGIGAAGVGAAGIGSASPVRLTAPARASADDDVLLTLTRLPDGSPELRRLVSAERRRRIRVYRDLDASGIVRDLDPVVGVGLTAAADAPGGPGASATRDAGLALALLVERATRRVRQSLPDRIQGVPTTVRPWRFDPEPARVCDRRVLTLFEPVVGGIATHAKRGDETFADGTVGLVCWDEDGAHCLLTAGHVASEDGEYADALYQDGKDGDGQYREQRIGVHAAHSDAGEGGLDVANYRVPDGVEAAPLASVRKDVPEVSGRWTFEGLADATADGRVPVSFSGRSTCYAEAACVGTFRSDLVDYAVRVQPAVATAGDSGGAYLDPDGRLVGLFTHRNPGDNLGPVGGVALDRVGARLSPPD